MKHWWWKILGLLLVAYSLIIGLNYPLGAGIYSTSPFVLKADSTQTIEIDFLNTHWQENPLMVLKNNNKYFCLENIEIITPTHIKAKINTSGLDYKKEITLVVENSTIGTLYLQNAFVMSDSSKMQAQECKEVPVKIAVSGAYFPYQPLLYESIRNLLFHVPMWFTMTLMLLVSFIYSIIYLSKLNPLYDDIAKYTAVSALFFGMLGIFTGMIWAKNTWGNYWTEDPKLNGAAIAILMYAAYLIIRNAIEDDEKRARVAAVANVFFFPLFVVLIYILPRLTASLHPGNGGNPGFGSYDLDNSLRKVFYPAVLGWILIGTWISQILRRLNNLNKELENEETE